MALLVLALIAFAAGAATGSFIGVIADRWPRGEPIGFDRSRCRGCHAELGARELIPVASFLLQRGHCRRCGTAIPSDLLWVELAGAAVGLLALWAADDLAATLPLAIFGWALLLIALLDARHFWIPARVTVPLIALGLASVMLVPAPDLADRLSGTAVGFVAVEGFGFAARRWTGRRLFANGESLLLAAMGAWFGLAILPWIVLLAAGLAIASECARRTVAAFNHRLPLSNALAFAGTIALPLAF